jgi:hypothetical protein
MSDIPKVTVSRREESSKGLGLTLQERLQNAPNSHEIIDR